MIRNEKQIRLKIKMLEKQMNGYEKKINKKQTINRQNIERIEELEDMYYECFTFINALRWVLGEEK